MKKLIALLSISYLLSFSVIAGCPPGNSIADLAPPTNLDTTFIRKGSGEYGASRLSGIPHKGVDLLVRASSTNKSAYEVKAVADGVIAYAKFNGSQLDKGFGNVVIIDHGNDCYSLMAHLASDPFTPLPNNPSAALMVKVGDKVSKGDIVGYFVDHSTGVDSTGNAMRTSAGARWQTHFEMLEASSGKSGSGSIRATFGNKTVDTTSLLIGLGYKVEDIAH